MRAGYNPTLVAQGYILKVGHERASPLAPALPLRYRFHRMCLIESAHLKGQRDGTDGIRAPVRKLQGGLHAHFCFGPELNSGSNCTGGNGSSSTAQRWYGIDNVRALQPDLEPCGPPTTSGWARATQNTPHRIQTRFSASGVPHSIIYQI